MEYELNAPKMRRGGGEEGIETYCLLLEIW